MSVAPDAARAESTLATAQPRSGWASLRDLNRYQWFVFAVAAIAWTADCMDQQLFALARHHAGMDLTGADGASKAVADFRSWSTALFLVGWGAGGLVFGMFGDRLGRVRTLTSTILLY